MNKSKSRKALGRGLSNLIPIASEGSDGKNEIHSVAISSIKTNPYQPRTDFKEEEIKGLADSIDKQGLLQPVVVRKKENTYEIVSGERRFRAFKLLKKVTVPCIVKKGISDREMLELALIENIQREDLNEIEKAIAYQKLLLDYSYTHEQLSEQIGKSRTSITNSLRLLNLPEVIQNFVRCGKLSMGHARALLSLKNHDILSVADKIINENLSVREVEKMGASVKSIKPSGNKKKESASLDPDLKNLIEKLEYKFGTSISISDSNKKSGKLTFYFYGMDDLSRIIDLLLK